MNLTYRLRLESRDRPTFSINEKVKTQQLPFRALIMHLIDESASKSDISCWLLNVSTW